MSKLLTDAQHKHLRNIEGLIKVAKEYANNIKVDEAIKNLKKEFNLTVKEENTIIEILQTKTSLFTPESSDGVLLRGFLLKIEEFGVKFPYRIKNVIKFDFENNFDIDYVYDFAKKKLEEHNKEEENSSMRKLIEEGKSVSEIASNLNFDEKKVHSYYKQYQRGLEMRKANPKVK